MIESFYIRTKLVIRILATALFAYTDLWSHKKESTPISYCRYGSGKTTLVFLHGWGQTKQTWEYIAVKLKSQYTVYLLDLPGFGRSGIPLHPLDIGQYAEEVEKFLAEQSIKECVIVGHSFGGKVSIVVGQKSKKVKKVVLYSVNLNLSEKGRAWKLYRTISLLHLYSPLMLQTFKHTHCEVNFKKYLPKFGDNVLLMYGKYDFITPVSFGKIIQSQMSRAKLKVFQHSSHLAHIEESPRFIKEITHFAGK